MCCCRIVPESLLLAALFAVAARSAPDDNPLERRMASSLGGHASARPAAERLSRAEEFNRTGVLQPEFQIRATLKPNDMSQFYLLSPKNGAPPTLLVSPCSGPIAWSVSYVYPPESDQHAEGQTHWPVKQLIPGSPLFNYEGADTKNFTIPATQPNLYRIDMRPINSPGLDLKTRSPNTVLLYATSDAIGHLPASLFYSGRSKRHQPLLEFQQKSSRRKLIVSWNKSHVDPSRSSYLLAVTKGAQLHPPTLCAAENIMKKHPCPSAGQARAKHRTEPEGLHCVRRSKLTLVGLDYNTTYYFTLYVINTHNNVSSKVSEDSFRFQRKLPIVLQSGRYATVNLRKSDGQAAFRFKPRDNTTTLFNILACGACSLRVKIRGGGYCWDQQIGGEFLHRAPALPPGKRFGVQLSASAADLVKMSKVKVLASEDEAFPFSDYMLQKNAAGALGSLSPASPASPWEYRTLRKCRAKPASWCVRSAASASGSSASGTRAASSTSMRPCNSRRPGPAHSLARPCPSPSATPR
ncbi:uncharacterized protein LOC131671546 isoform X1 [Phymastichus coffea]|uniref:uncharacterized protein LOC131671546 isoform X1 n=1 Tax=Phymastichus coffea TaxID=108790 RepID=UPI00273C1271|nr:uncharacterized protein LOC131671546 isoform X1 [Phymastichus coffea]